MKPASFILLVIISVSCGTMVRESGKESNVTDSLVVNNEGMGQTIDIHVEKGSSFYYPLLAIWIEDMEGNYLQTLYVARSVATGTFRFGETKGGKWSAGAKRYPQTLPYWAHKRGVMEADGFMMPTPERPVPDAYTGATPVRSFHINARTDSMLTYPFRVMMEINQNWDFNDYWTNDKFPDDQFYKLSCQPAVVYEALIDGKGDYDTAFKAIGHSHWSGKTGELFADLTTLTTALKIVGKTTLRVAD